MKPAIDFDLPANRAFRQGGKMKKLLMLLLLTVLISFSTDSAEFNYGVNIDLGGSALTCGNLKDALEFSQLADPDIKKYTAKGTPGFGFELGGYFEYIISEVMDLRLSINFQSIRSTISIDKIEDDSHTVLTWKNDIQSQADFNLRFISVPIVCKFKLGETGKVFLLGGLEFKFPTSAEMSSEETVVEETYTLGELTDSQSVTLKYDAIIDSLNTTMTDLILGAGMEFPFGKSVMEILISINVPLSKKDLYTFNPWFHDIAENNEVFTYYGRSDIYQDTGKSLDDFTNWSLFITATYRLGSIGGSSTEEE